VLRDDIARGLSLLDRERGVSLFLVFADDEAAIRRVDEALNAMSRGEGGDGGTAMETYEVLLDESR
jgi:hypothetical protein